MGWIAQALGIELWGRQAEILNAVRDHQLVAVRSGHAIGKSAAAACLVCAYLESHSPGYAITTASSWGGVEGILWPELRRIIRRAPYRLGGRLLQTEWQRGDQWKAWGVSTDEPENFSGFHNPGGTLVIVDEASALGPEIMEAIMGLMTSPTCRLLLIGNPLRPDGPFHDAFHSEAWETLVISSLESPNIVEGREVIPGLATREWLDARREQWGENSPTYAARVLGEFPESAEDVLIPLAWLDAAQKREAPEIDQASLLLGVDVARFGSDRTVLIVRDKHAVRHVEAHEKESTMETAGRVQVTARQFGIPASRVFVDDGGLGGGSVDRLNELGFGVNAINFGGKSEAPDQFANVRAGMYWNLRDALDPAKDDKLAIPPRFAKLAAECGVAEYEYTSRGQIILKSKDKIKAKLGRSPDLADALALTFAKPKAEAWFL